MALVKSKSSCFVDALELALGAPADVVADHYKRLVEGSMHRPDIDGYHASIVNMILLELYDCGISEIDFCPVGEDSNEIHPAIAEIVGDWFKRPDFRAVVTGLRLSDNVPHAIAFRDGRWVDPAGPTHLTTPNIGFKHVWVRAVPPLEVPNDDQT